MEEITDKAIAPVLTGEDLAYNRFGYKIPNGYEFDCIKNNEIIIKPKQPQYPKTYKECCDVLGLNTLDNDAQGYKGDLIIRFQELLIARDSYWKIAGEQMGLGKPWKPDYNNPDIDLYVIISIYNRAEKATYGYGFPQCVLAFPTKEIRDDFLENFKELIKECISLL